MMVNGFRFFLVPSFFSQRALNLPLSLIFFFGYTSFLFFRIKSHLSFSNSSPLSSPCQFSNFLSKMLMSQEFKRTFDILQRILQTMKLELRGLLAQDVALRKRQAECSVLQGKNQEMLAEGVPKKKAVDNFMVFFTAIENNDLEIAKKFGEKVTMIIIATMMNSDTGDNGGFLGWLGVNNFPGIDLSPEEKAAIDAIVALENGVGCVGSANGGFTGGHGGINNALENAYNGEEDKMTATEGTKAVKAAVLVITVAINGNRPK